MTSLNQAKVKKSKALCLKLYCTNVKITKDFHIISLTLWCHVLITAKGWTNVHIRSVGCFKDKPRRAVGSMVANLRGLKFVVRDCARQARKRGYRLFAVQNGGECWMGPRAKLTYKKYGTSKRCRGGKGGPWANNVYVIIVKGMSQALVYNTILL